MKKLIYFAMSVLMLNVAQAQTKETTEADKIIGVWEVGSGKARVKISKYGEKFGGKLVWLKEPNYADGTKKVDKNNPDEAKRTVPLLGYTNLLGFSYKGKSEYEGGTIYDPENGNTYNCVISLEDDNTIKVRGYVGVQIFGRTDTWKRVTVKTK
ncbi:MAG: DUF2147 domain-containing protein [Bacteroidia bacterium]